MIILNSTIYTFNVSFTICSFLFYILLLIVYFHKNTIYSIKNVIYRKMIITGIFSFIFQFVYYFLIHFSRNLFWIGLVKKFEFISILILIILWIYYVLILVFEKNNKASGFISQHHATIDIYMMIIILIITIIECFLPISFSYGKLSLVRYVYGASFIYPWIISCVPVIIPIPFIIHEKCFLQKRLIPYYVFLFLFLLLGVVSYFWKEVSLLGFVVTICFYLIYYRLENPDITYIRTYYKDHERLRSLREKYGFLFNMSPELRDLLNEISFMKDNYLVDEKKRVSKRKLDALISDFIKSGEIGQTTKTNVDDDGIEILEMDDDIPEELLVTKEIYSLKELQEVLKEDNLPKW